jgi:GNAT superfamily N-acetyltransferase
MIGEEKVSEIWDEACALLPGMAPDPDRQAYAEFEAAGQLRCYTARAEGKLVGYVVFFVREHMHYRGSRQAMQDVLVLHPGYRSGTTAAMLLRTAETHLRGEGVQVVYHHAKRSTQDADLLGRLGYELVEGIYAKRLN